MKELGKKGVSTVLATMLLVALVMAGVGIVVVILSAISPPSGGINTFLTVQSVENDATGNEMKVKLTNWGPDDIISGSISITIDGMYDRDANPESPHWESGSAEKLPDTGSNPAVSISWVTGSPPENLKAGMWPWKVGAGSELSIVLQGSDALAFKPTGIVIRDATTKTVLCQNSSLPDPMP